MTHPGEKRMVEYAKDYGKILPKNFEENLTSLFSNMFSDKENTLLILENICNRNKKSNIIIIKFKFLTLNLYFSIFQNLHQ